MDPDNVKVWLKQHIGDASRAPVKILADKRVLQPYMGFTKGGIIAMIYREQSTKEYYARIADKELGFFPSTLSFDELITRVAQSYARANT